MAECKYCGKKGLLLKVTRNGLCKKCDPIIVMSVKQYARVIQDSVKLIEKSKNMETKLFCCDTILEHAQYLAEYERKGIPTFKPEPSKLIKKYASKRDNIIFERRKRRSKELQSS